MSATKEVEPGLNSMALAVLLLVLVGRCGHVYAVKSYDGTTTLFGYGCGSAMDARSGSADAGGGR